MTEALDKIDSIYQYSLLVAGDSSDHALSKLGPIHLLKYLYLADLEYSKRNGSSYTGLQWQFFNFGPWSQIAHKRIEHSMSAINATKHTFASQYTEDDFFRFEKRDSEKLKRLERDLPPLITRKLKSLIKEFGSLTPDLLDFVYKTEPMLNASPNEMLDLSVQPTEKYLSKEENLTLSVESKLSNKRHKNIRNELKELKQKLAGFCNANELVNPTPEAKYDNIYFEGLAMLEAMDIPNFNQKEITIEFNDLIWKSDARKGIYGK